MKRKIILLASTTILFLSLFGLLFLRNQFNQLTNNLFGYQNSIKIKKPNNQLKGHFVYGANNSAIHNLNQLNHNRHLDADLSLRGYIAAPKQNGLANPVLTLPIYEGVSDRVLSYGAGTAKPNQIIGENNFAISAHNFADNQTFFSSLQTIDVAQKPKVYLFDGENIFVYQLEQKRVVTTDDSQVIFDNPDQTEITLTTCDQPFLNLTTKNRIVVSGTFLKRIPIEDTNNQIKQLFT